MTRAPLNSTPSQTHFRGKNHRMCSCKCCQRSSSSTASHTWGKWGTRVLAQVVKGCLVHGCQAESTVTLSYCPTRAKLLKKQIKLLRIPSHKQENAIKSLDDKSRCSLKYLRLSNHNMLQQRSSLGEYLSQPSLDNEIAEGKQNDLRSKWQNQTKPSSPDP